MCHKFVMIKWGKEGLNYCVQLFTTLFKPDMTSSNHMQAKFREGQTSLSIQKLKRDQSEFLKILALDEIDFFLQVLEFLVVCSSKL